MEETKVKANFSVDEYDRKILAGIEEHGHVVQGVGSDPGSKPQFAYTVGRTLDNRPEFYIVGPLEISTLTAVLNRIVEIDKIQPIGPGEEVSGVISGLTVKCVEVDADKCEMFMATRIYGDSVVALQVLWPDENDLFPGEVGYDLPGWVQPVGGEEVAIEEADGVTVE